MKKSYFCPLNKNSYDTEKLYPCRSPGIIVAGSDENLSPIMHHLWKMEGGAIYFCRSGWAHVTIDLKEYEIVKNTQVVLLPGSIIRINGSSSDFTASFFGFPKDMFRKPACG